MTARRLAATQREIGESAAADDLVDAVRRLMHAAATTSRGDDTVRQLCRRLDEISAAFEVEPLDAVRRIPLDDDRLAEIHSGQVWRMFPFNPLGIPQSIRVEDGVASSVIELGPLHEGPPGLLHGGFSAAVLDALIGVAVMAEVVPSYSARLDVSFVHAVPLRGTIEARGWVTQVKGRHILAAGTISHAGRVAVEARGVFVPMPTPVGDRDLQLRARADGSQSG